MGTYTPEKLLKEYSNNRMDVEMAMGHALQNIEMLDDAKTKANQSRTKLSQQNEEQGKKIKALEKQVMQLEKTAQQQQEEIDSLKIHLQSNKKVNPSTKNNSL